MPLPSQSARSSSAGRSPMYRRKRGPGSLLVVVGLVAAAAVAVWSMLPSGERDRMTTPGAVNAKPAAQTPGNPIVEAPRQPDPVPAPPKAEPPIVEISQGLGNPQARPGEAGASGLVPAAPPAPRAEVIASAPPPSSAIDQVPSVAAARQKQQEGDLVSARALFSRVLADDKLMASEQQTVRDELARINDDLVFSSKVTPGDPFAEKYKVQPNDSLVKISQRQKLNPDWRLIQRVNRMPDANRLREGQQLKLIRGPFHVVVHKSQYRLDLYMGPPDDQDSWLFIRSFTVGLGDGNSTPTGTFIVKAASKLVDPYWVNPRTGERFAGSDPKNPIGEYWIGLEGVGESLSHVGYGIHGTIDPDSIGKQKSMGCVRLAADDIALMYELLGEQTSIVRIEP